MLTCYKMVRCTLIPVFAKKHPCGEADIWEDELSDHQIRGWRSVLTAGLKGKGWSERIVVFHRHR